MVPWIMPPGKGVWPTLVLLFGLPSSLKQALDWTDECPGPLPQFLA
jgi:hypothetical protein